MSTWVSTDTFWHALGLGVVLLMLSVLVWCNAPGSRMSAMGAVLTAGAGVTNVLFGTVGLLVTWVSS